MTVVIAALSMTAALAQSGSFYVDADQFYKKYVENGFVDYKGIKTSGAHESLIREVAKTDLSGKSSAEIQAFYINAYNLYVIKKIVDNYGIQSVMDVDQFFDKKDIKVAGKTVSLNQLEKEMLLKKYGDARYHFVLVCGAVDCPPLASFAYTPSDLENQLAKRTQKAMNDPKFIKTNGSKASISQLFDWYASDFGGKSNVVNYINKYRTNNISGPVEYYNYDWSLNGK